MVDLTAAPSPLGPGSTVRCAALRPG